MTELGDAVDAIDRARSRHRGRVVIAPIVLLILSIGVWFARPDTIAFSAGGDLTALVPARLFESRVGESTVDGLSAGGGRVGAGSVTEVVVAGRGGVDVDASSVLLNVTAVLPSAAGFLTVFPCGGALPGSSNVNYVAGDVVANAVLAKVGVGGKVCVFSLAEADLVVDVNGFVPAVGALPSTTSTSIVAIGPPPTVPTTSSTTTTSPTTSSTTSSSSTTSTTTNSTTTTTTNSTTSTTSSTTSTTSSTTSSTTTTTSTVPVATLVPPSTTMPPPSSPTSGAFEFLGTFSYGGQTIPARWNPCEPIEYLVNADRATPSQITLMNKAIATVEQATALDFVFVGVTSEGLDPLEVPTGRGADAVLVFSDETATPGLAGSVIGLGGSSWMSWVDGGTPWAERVSGGAMVDVDASDGIQERVWMHEIGHMLGLDHVSDPTELMFFSLGNQPGFGPGDLEGLWNLGAAQPCIPDRPFGASTRSADLGGPDYDVPTGDADW